MKGLIMSKKIRYILIFLSLFISSCGMIDDGFEHEGEGSGYTPTKYWSYPLEHLFYFPDIMKPIADNGKAYVAADTSLVCRELESGKELWRIGLGNNLPLGTMKLLHSEDRIFINHYNIVKAFRKDNGELIWQTEIPDFVGVDLSVMCQNKTALFLGADNSQVARINKESGVVEMRIAISQLLPDSIGTQRAEAMSVSKDNYLYVPTGYWTEGMKEIEGNLLCYNANTGEYLWGVNYKNEYNGGLTTCGVYEDLVIHSTGEYVIARNRFTGEKVWEKYFEDDAFDQGVTVIGETTYIASCLGYVYALESRTGKLLSKTYVTYTAHTIFTDYEDKVFFCNNGGGGSWIFKKKNGKLLWHGDAPGNTSDKYDSFLSSFAVWKEYMVNIGTKKVYCVRVPV